MLRYGSRSLDISIIKTKINATTKWYDTVRFAKKSDKFALPTVFV
jgi:hypothetical protein